MELDLAIEVREVAFDQFERRRYPRENRFFIEIKGKYFFDHKSYQVTEPAIDADLGIEVREVTFDQFERRVYPRCN